MRRKKALQPRPGSKTPAESPAGRKPWEEPRLNFVEPRLTKHGSLEKVTRGRKRNGFFGEFSP
jgi:hypothetical protein